ncbi:hypothetical protein Mal52_12840 [Symmachiella dynata]|uniref:Uncharacterized protein n=1 Tax=Symmachiella dynata TaxID=2527995 RepID=A0A517ZK50_9PLAN|nr:hypothetical protein Mal52_12840 [Symmachiella dynata]
MDESALPILVSALETFGTLTSVVWLSPLNRSKVLNHAIQLSLLSEWI